MKMKEKALFVMVAIAIVFLLASVANAWTLSWEASAGAGVNYRVYSCDVNAPDIVAVIDNGAALNYDLDSAGLTVGTRYEFWVTAYNTTGESPDSEHVRWTMPSSEPIIIEMMGAPVQIIINP